MELKRTAVCFVFVFGVAAASASKYQPLSSAVYDLGPLDKCVRLPLELCYTVYGLSNDTIIPQREALRIAQQKTLYTEFQNSHNTSSECEKYLYYILCFVGANEVCIGNGLVKRKLAVPVESISKVYIVAAN